MRYGKFVLFAVALAAILAPTLSMSDDSSAATYSDIRVYIENASGEYDMSVVGGVSTVKEAIEAAAADQGKTIALVSNGSAVRSVDGLEPESDKYWRVHQWLPLGTSGWKHTALDKSDGMVSGTSYCLHICERVNIDGSQDYVAPDFKPESEGYIFFRFANGFIPTIPEVLEAFTSEVRKEGFWLKGTGSTMAEVLDDAIKSNGFDVELNYTQDKNGNNIQGWIKTMFGLGDELEEGSDDIWHYWSQWTWVEGDWSYNEWTLGFYDPAVYKYVMCIYLISTPDPYSTDYIIDVGGDLPNPDKEEVICISNHPVVTFALPDGTAVATQVLKYGETPNMALVPEPEAPKGKTFSGWGDTTVPIVRDTTFTANFIDAASYMVRYWDESKTAVLYAETVASGSSSTYKGTTPYKAPTSEFRYEFEGWSADLTHVTSDMDVTPVFKAVPLAHEHSWGEGVVTKAATCVSEGVKTYTCSCGEVKTEPIPALGHSWSEWKVTKQPTSKDKGTETRTCSVCGETESRDIPPTGEDSGSGSDNTMLYVGAAIAAIVAIAIIAVIVMKRKG